MVAVVWAAGLMTHSQEAESDEFWGSALLLLTQSGTPAQGIMSPTFRLGLLTSINLI